MFIQTCNNNNQSNINLKGAGPLRKAWGIWKNEREGQKQCNYILIKILKLKLCEKLLYMIYRKKSQENSWVH